MRGSGFIPYSLIRLGDHRLTTRFLGPSHIEAEVPAALLQRGTHDVTVENPDFAFGTTSGAGLGDLVHLGIRPRISNAFPILIKPPGRPIFMHPNEAAHSGP